MKAGRILIALMFAIGLIGVFVSGAVLYSRFLYLSLLLSLFAWGWTHWAARGLAVERRTRELRANVGDVFRRTIHSVQ
jgi:hypothetical protein